MKQIFCFALLLLYMNDSGYCQGTKLALNLPEGYHYNTESSVNLLVEQEFMGIRYSTKMEINTQILIQVKGINADSNYILSASYQKMNIHVTSLLINMEVNTESSLPGDSLSVILKSLLGKEFTILQSCKGRVSDITGLDEMISETIGSSSLPGEQKLEFTRNLIQSIGRDVLLDNYSSNSPFYPEFRVKAPVEWDFRSPILKSGIPMELYSHVRLKSISKNMAVMFSEGRIIKQDIENQPGQLNSAAKINNLSGDEVSEIKMDVRTGLILESIVSQNVSGTMRTPSEVKSDEEMVIPFKIISRSIMNTLPFK